MSKQEKNVFAQELEKIKNTNVDDVIDDLRIINPVQSLRLSIFEFFKNRLKYIEKDNVLRAATEAALLKKINNDELSINQLINLMNDTKQQATLATDSVFSILKPVPNSQSILDSSIDRKEREEDSPMGELSKDESEALQNLSILLRQIDKNREEEITGTYEEVEKE
jgi:hypothetical protein